MFLNTWLNGLLSWCHVLFLPGLRFSKEWKARQYLVDIIERKIYTLNKSTLIAMVYATDDESTKSLSNEQIIDNALFLAGPETSSSTLTNCLLLLGLHPHVWKKIQLEQRSLVAKFGTHLTKKDQLDNECQYLEAVIKESMRIRPLSGGQYHRTKATMIVDGMQIPQGWPITYNSTCQPKS